MESSSKSMVSLDPAWPKISIAEANAALTAPGARFEMETVLVGGIATRVWKNAPHDLGALLDLSRTHGERLFTILDDERSEEHTSELQSLMRISYAVFCLKKKTNDKHKTK